MQLIAESLRRAAQRRRARRPPSWPRCSGAGTRATSSRTSSRSRRRCSTTSTRPRAARSSTWWSTRPSRRAPAAGRCSRRLDLGVPVTGIAEAVFARSLSGRPEQRAAAAGLPGPQDAQAAVLGAGTAHRLVDDVERALFASKVVAYAQGFDQIAARQRRVRLGDRPRRHGHHLARRLHHPRPVPRSPAPGVRRRSDAADAARRPVLRRGPGGRAGRVATGGGHRRCGRRADAGLRHRRWPTTTPSAVPACRPRSSRGCATCSAPTPTGGSTGRARSTPAGPTTGPKRSAERRRRTGGHMSRRVRM